MTGGSSGQPLPYVCGIDLSSLGKMSCIAWLRDRQFLLDAYAPSLERPLPVTPVGWGPPMCTAIDGPQGLPGAGTRREADAEADTPTRRLPLTREGLARFQPYGALVRAGVEIFWKIHESRVAAILGLESEGIDRPTVAETYPRYVAKRLWRDMKPPSKSQHPAEYAFAVWERLREAGYSCPSVVLPTVDQADAMLCGVAAQSCYDAHGRPAGRVGKPPMIDPEEAVLREGHIAAP